MIARHETQLDRVDIWSKLSAPVSTGVISWRQDGRPVQRDGKFFARFVAYIEANTVRERLDGVVPGEWDLTLDLLPALATAEDGEQGCSFKARLQILGVIREDVGTGRDYKSAATDAFKRAAVRFGIGHELYAYEQNWVQVDSDSRYAKPLEEPAEAYARRVARKESQEPSRPSRQRAARAERIAEAAEAPVVADDSLSIAPDVQVDAAVAAGPLATDEPSCPKCGGRMWDNRLSKRNPKAPDFKCRSRSCDGVVWPPKGGATPETDAGAAAVGSNGSRKAARGNPAGPLVPEASGYAPVSEADEIPF